ncbi:MAG: ATP-binding cassette domain-containing protein [Ignavibacteriae bacterium]|nr:ATP-binding cassette domain-containing protein [Ignavibacteria bacterium]MBI3364563.1 ATP-binding cassette domain-containing protein [Ignavibacteriota bacterium]
MSVLVSNLSKYYGDAKAVDDISFEVHSGEILGFLGPNGAGKTTTMRIITSYHSPSSGTIKVEGRDVLTESLEVRKLVGYLPEQNPLYLDMNVLEYLEYAAQLQGVTKTMIPQRMREMVGVCGLGDMKHKDIGQLSKGYRQRVGLAAAMIHDPRVLILDEPTSGLDPNQIVEIRSLIQDLGKQKTVVLSTHILPEVQATCDRVVIINRGKIVADGPIADLQRNLHGGEKIVLEIEVPDGQSFDMVSVQVKNIPAIATVSLIDERNGVKRFSVETTQAIDIRRDLFQLCVQKGWGLLELHREQTSLEDIFRQLTSNSAR